MSTRHRHDTASRSNFPPGQQGRSEKDRRAKFIDAVAIDARPDAELLGLAYRLG